MARSPVNVMMSSPSALNGGLGGLVDIQYLGPGSDDCHEQGLFGSWPLRRKRRPISTPRTDMNGLREKPSAVTQSWYASEEYATPQTPDFKSPTTPRTPRTPHTPNFPMTRLFTEDHTRVLSPYNLGSSGGAPSPMICSPKSFPSMITLKSCPENTERMKQIPLELPGSLLLPSQGYPQTVPPTPPQRPDWSSRSSSTQSQSSSVPSLSPSSQTSRSDTQLPEVLRIGIMPESSANRRLPPSPPCLATSPSNMPRSSTETPIPLSQMSLEKLMDILPYLDAAIIANDWIPCVKKRHVEVKATFQTLSENNLSAKKEVAELAKQLLHVVDTINELAKKCEGLFGEARKLQSRDTQRTIQDLEIAQSSLRSALASLAQQRAQNKEESVHRALQLEELRNTMAHTVNLLGDFIYQNMSAALYNSKEPDVHEVLQVIANSSPQHSGPSSIIPFQLYTETQNALRKSEDQVKDQRSVLLDQNDTIRQQAEQIEDFVQRFERVVDRLKDKEHEIASLTHENKVLQKRLQEERAIAEQITATQADDNLELTESEQNLQVLEQEIDEQLLKRDAEITNLRRKLTDSTIREQKLQKQIRSLIQKSQKDLLPNNSSQRRRLKRLLTGDKSTALGLGLSLFGADMLLSSDSQLQPSTEISSHCTIPTSSSPMLGMVCDPNLKPSRNPAYHRRGSSLDIPSRPIFEQFESDKAEIDTAVSKRFAQLPANIQRERRSNSVPDITFHAATPVFPSSENATNVTDANLGVAKAQGEPHSDILYILPPRTPSSNGYNSLPGYQRALSGIMELPEDGSNANVDGIDRSYKKKTS